MKVIADLEKEEEEKKKTVPPEPIKKTKPKREEPRIKADQERMRREKEKEEQKEKERQKRLEREERKRIEKEEEIKRIEKENQERIERMEREKTEDEEKKRLAREKDQKDEQGRSESMIKINEYEIKLDYLDKIKIIDEKKRATYVIFGEIFYEFIAFLTELLEDKELFYIIVMGGSSIEKQCSEYKTNDVDVKFIPYDLNTVIEYNDSNYKFIINVIDVFINKLDYYLQQNLNLIYNKIKDKFDDKVDLDEYKDALRNSINYEQDRKNVTKELFFSLNVFKKQVQTNFESKSNMYYQKIIIDLSKYTKNDNNKSPPSKLRIDANVIMDVSIYKANNIYRKLIENIGPELMSEKQKRVPKFLKKNGLNLVHIDYLLKEKELLKNSTYDTRDPKNKDNLKNNFIDIEDVDEKMKEKRFDYIKNKSELQYNILKACFDKIKTS